MCLYGDFMMCIQKSLIVQITCWGVGSVTFHLYGPEHACHFVQPHVAAHCGGPEHTRATCGGDMYVMYANALSVAGTSHSLSHT